MRSKSYGAFAAAMVAALMLTLAACGDDDDDGGGGGGGGGGDKVKVACVLKSLESPFWLAAQDGCEKAAEAAGAELIFGAGETEADIAGEISKVEDALTQGAEALVVAPSAPDQLQPVLDRAARDVPVLLLDTDIPGMDSKTSYVGTDNVAAGELGGKYILDNGGKGKFGIVTGDPGITSIEDRIKGAKQAWEGSAVELVQTVNARGCTRDAGVTVTEDLLTAHPDLAGIFFVCDQPMLGGVEAIKKAGKKPEDLFILGFDAEPEAVDLVEQGVIDGDVAQFPSKMGELGIENAIKAIDGEEVPKFIDSGAEVVTKENAAQFK
jgi:ABC-type sugar transport system substrate-binding protein